MSNITINDDYIQDMLNKHPLSKENPVDMRDYTLDVITEAVSSNTIIPEEFHINYSLPVKVKQKNIGACNACTCAAAYMIQKAATVPFSWWFLYANRLDSDYQGIGSIPREVLNHMKNEGVTSLELFNIMKEYPDIRTDLIKNSNKDKIFVEAAKNKISGYVKIEKEDVRRLVSQGIPVLIGVKVYTNFYEAVNNNYVIPSVPIGNKIGNHEMLITGYKGKDYNLLNWWDGEWDHDLILNEDSNIISDYYIITDKPISKPVVKKYRVGWDKDPNGKWLYSKDGDTLVQNDWLQWKGKWYFMNKDGTMHTEWLQDSKERWFYLDVDKGYAYTGWVYINGKWYYFNNDCIMQTGWLQYKDKWYYLDIDKGYCYSNCTILIDSKNYSFDLNGAWIESPDNAIFKGIDVSSHNGNIDFNKVKTYGIDAVYIKATEGTTFMDSYLNINYCGARQAGLKTGFYHFLVGTSSPETQANNFYNQIKDKQSDLKPCLDIETLFEGLMDYALKFISKFKELSCMEPCIYTYSGFMNNLDSRLSRYSLWEANYNNTPWDLPGNFIWTTRVGHQYTELGTINGINTAVDINEFNQDILR
ncbi:hypothetical protein D2A34_21985 [Clostridium chromiireducens]|uniref:Lysozyme n=1 Tax=Clostridium chromiireducens TaxID=225345 RepID=A0A399IIP0_9CLOT|nr:GH25 family lysozyme [Clostridium chromiireducens]RII32868.1 hypothetical protein D2A34_21985 [Clostridium chromiireducens]